MTTRHEFLAQLHDLIQPRGYLEIGVQYGTSLALAKCPAIGIDPAPMLQGHFKDTRVFTMTSDQFFHDYDPVVDLFGDDHLDLAFIDGMHLYEYALRDFMNVEEYSNPRTVVVLDDVLPYNAAIATREQPPGDWTGDVWKVPLILRTWRPDLHTLLVDTEPTGTAVVFGLNPESKKLRNLYPTITLDYVTTWEDVPEPVLSREGAVSAEEALLAVAFHLQVQDGDGWDEDSGHRGERIHRKGDPEGSPGAGA